jgi:iron(III) transport system ATP-binding protein
MADKLATQLSGGQQQRAALARAIVSNPRLLLFDEPLSNLDLKLREQMRVELKRIQNEVGITSVYVTHDQSEALVMSDDIIVMSKGKIEQTGGPVEIYSKPVNGYVSNFIGVANLLNCRVLESDGKGHGKVQISEGGQKIAIECQLGAGIDQGGDAIVSIRPENIEAVRENGDGAILEGEVLEAIFLGNYVDCRIRWGDFEWKVIAHPRSRLKAGEKVYLRFDPNHTLAVQP